MRVHTRNNYQQKQRSSADEFKKKDKKKDKEKNNTPKGCRKKKGL